MLEERATALLADATGQVHPRLQPVYDALLAARRPQTVIYWFTRSDGPNILTAMARGHIDISHDSFERLPATKAVGYVRDLLVAVGVLPAYDAPIERIGPWLADILSAIPADHAVLVERFARWHVLRHLRQHAQAGTLTQGTISSASGSFRASALS